MRCYAPRDYVIVNAVWNIFGSSIKKKVSSYSLSWYHWSCKRRSSDLIGTVSTSWYWAGFCNGGRVVGAPLEQPAREENVKKYLLLLRWVLEEFESACKYYLILCDTCEDVWRNVQDRSGDLGFAPEGIHLALVVAKTIESLVLNHF